MRNDARPIGEESPASPIGGHDTPPHGTDDPGDVSHDRQSSTVNGENAQKPELDHESPRPAPGTYHPE
jgi:hypothetical protein